MKIMMMRRSRGRAGATTMGLLMVTRVCVRETDREGRRGFGGAGSDQNLWQGLLEYFGDDCYCTHPARRSPPSVIGVGSCRSSS